MPQQAIVTTQPTSPPIALCDEPGCSEPAVFTYMWEWGASGNVCSKHQALHAQRQESLQRRCTFSLMQAALPPELVRSERIQLRAEIGALEAECDEVKARGLDMYNQNLDLTRQVQALRIRSVECDAQLRDALGKVQLQESALMDRDATIGEMTQEIGRLKALVPRDTPTPPTRSGRGVRSQQQPPAGESVIAGSGKSSE